MTIRENLDLIDDILDTALSVPLSRGKSIVDIDKIRDALDNIRLNMPSELKQAKMIVEDRKTIIDDARKEADSIVKIAEERAKKLVDTSEIVKQSQERDYYADQYAKPRTQTRCKRVCGNHAQESGRTACQFAAGIKGNQTGGTRAPSGQRACGGGFRTAAECAEKSGGIQGIN